MPPDGMLQKILLLTINSSARRKIFFSLFSKNFWSGPTVPGTFFVSDALQRPEKVFDWYLLNKEGEMA